MSSQNSGCAGVRGKGREIMSLSRFWQSWRAAMAVLALAAPLLGTSALAVPAASPVPAPTVTRAPSVGQPWSSATLDIDAGGYVEEEYFIEGTARSFEAMVNFTDTRNGQWDATPTGPTAPYKVRVLVERPRDPARFNGIVIVEWFNVSAMMDGGSFSSFGDWVMREGYAYVGVSAQAAGVNHLRSSNAERYGSLAHPGDSHSYDIFSQAAPAIRSGALLGDLTPRVRALVAWGGSQSGGRLVTYINAAHPTARVYDAFLPYVTGWSAALTQDPSSAGPPGPSSPSMRGPGDAALMIRTDVPTPILIQNSENEALGSARGFHQQPDSANFRLWEHAGTAHASARTAAALGTRRGTSNAATTPGLTCENPPANGLHAGPIWRAMMDAMRVWVLEGRAPESAPRIEISVPADASQPARVVRDPATGIGNGGIRLPQIAAPVASRWGERPSGLQENPSCRLYGASDPWNGNADAWDGTPQDLSPNPEPSLRALYRNNAGYVRRVRDSANGLVRHGWLLEEDARALTEEARSVQIQ
jgi:hypothetical protein